MYSSQCWASFPFLERHSRNAFWNGNGNGYKNRNGNGNAERIGYRIINGNEERERLDRNMGTSSSGTRSFTSTEIYIVLIQDICYIYFIIYYNINKEVQRLALQL